MFSVIFDMDGTLLDTQRVCIPAWQKAGEDQGIENAGECIKDVCGMNENGWSNFLLNRYPGIDLDKFKNDVREYITKNLIVTFKEGGEELLDFLKANNVKVAIASGSSVESITHHLKAVKAYEKIDAIAGGKEVENGKPAPDIFLLAAKRLGAQPKDCFVFEDSTNGIIAGHKAGMRCIGVPDIVDFKDDIKKLMFTHLDNLGQAIEILKEYL